MEVTVLEGKVILELPIWGLKTEEQRKLMTDRLYAYFCGEHTEILDDISDMSIDVIQKS